MVWRLEGTGRTPTVGGKLMDLLHKNEFAMKPGGRGYFLLGHVTVLGARLHLHWSAVALAGLMLGAWHRQPGLAIEAIACYFGLILLHEAGHAAMALRLGYRAPDIYLSMVHGLCSYDRPDTPREDALIAWGGVLAQLAIALPLIALAQVPTIASLPSIGIPIAAFGYFSLSMVALNLVPVRGLDGAKAWSLLPMLGADLRADVAARKTAAVVLRKSSGAPRRATAPSRSPHTVPVAAETANPGPSSARWLATECARLSKAGATWPEIGNELNPQHDRQVGELIQRVRASHMSAPLQALKLIESACLVTLADNDDASGVDALTEAVGGLGSLAKVRW
jgi:Zn-dependent protease